jgi:hypothetical protein
VLTVSRREQVENQTKGLSKKEKKEAELALQQAETELLRNKRRKITVRDFENVKLIGRGAFGEVNSVLAVQAHIILRFELCDLRPLEKSLP